MTTVSWILLAGLIAAIGLIVAMKSPSVKLYSIPGTLTDFFKLHSVQILALQSAIDSTWLLMDEQTRAMFLTSHQIIAVNLALGVLAKVARRIQQPISNPTLAAAKAAGDPDKPGGQSGRARVSLLAVVAFCAGCATVVLPPPKNAMQAAVYAESTATAVDTLADHLLLTHAITKNEATDVLKSSRAVLAACVTARAFAKSGDEASADAKISAVQNDVQVLLSFLESHK